MSDDLLNNDWTDPLTVSSTGESRKSRGGDVEVNSAAAAKVTRLILDYWTRCHCMLWLDTVDVEK